MKQNTKYGAIAVAVVVAVIVINTAINGGDDKIDAPSDSSELIGKESGEVEQLFKDAGFENVTVTEKPTVEEDDDGKVASVKIGDYSVFSKGDGYLPTDAVEITEEKLETLEAKLSVETGGSEGRPEFKIKTNLPDKTVFKVEISNGTYSNGESVTIKDGEATSDAFFGEGHDPLVGDYTVTVEMSVADQPNKVKKVIGDDGEVLTGEYVKKDEVTGKRLVAYEMDYHSAYTEDDIESAQSETGDLSGGTSSGMTLEDVRALIEESMAQGFEEGTYSVIADGSGITISVAQSGMAAAAMLAKKGDAEQVKNWNEVVESTKDSCLTAKTTMLDRFGYGDKMLVFNVLNDVSQENTLLTVVDGEVVYDVVNGINILGV